MQMALCSFLSLTGPSLWPQAVIKAVISSYSLKESARLWEGLREGWGGREGGRKRGRTAGCRRRDGTILFLKMCRVVEPAFWGKKRQCFHNCCIPPSLPYAAVQIHYNSIFYESPNAFQFSLPVGLLIKKAGRKIAITSDSRVQIEVTLQSNFHILCGTRKNLWRT